MREIFLQKSKQTKLQWSLSLFSQVILLYIGLKEGESAKVDDLLAIIGPKGVEVSHLVDNFSMSNEVPCY